LKDYYQKKRTFNHQFLTQEQKEELKKDLKSQPKELGLKEEFWTFSLLREYLKKEFKEVYKSNQSKYELC